MASFPDNPPLGTRARRLPPRLRQAVWVTLGLLVVTVGAILALYIGSGARPHRPNLEVWLNDGGRALGSPAARFGRRK
ncbi:MAG TPA: hypothetical protein VFH57_04550 [Gammaproteobacteria bacterium]|nr:hypothetical protein [Gammaproteobacteria bacterium]